MTKILGTAVEISAKAGITFEFKGAWYKTEYMETRIIPEGSDIVEERQNLFDTVNNEIAKQVDEVYGTP